MDKTIKSIVENPDAREELSLLARMVLTKSAATVTAEKAVLYVPESVSDICRIDKIIREIRLAFLVVWKDLELEVECLVDGEAVESKA